MQIVKHIRESKAIEYLYEFDQNEIFKFGGVEYIGKTLEDCTLYFNQLEAYNDPFELAYRYNHSFSNNSQIKEHFNEYKEGNLEGKNHNFIEHIKSQIEKELKTFVSSCFSTSPFEPLMWSHYAENHEGVVYCFDRDIMFDDENLKCRSIRYSSQIPDIHFFDGLSNKALLNPQIEDVIFTKSKHWSYEKEIRFIKQSKENIHSYNPKSLKAIILGSRIDIDKEDEICEKIEEFNKKNDTKVQLLYANCSNLEFKMEIRSRRRTWNTNILKGPHDLKSDTFEISYLNNSI